MSTTLELVVVVGMRLKIITFVNHSTIHMVEALDTEHLILTYQAFKNS